MTSTRRRSLARPVTSSSTRTSVAAGHWSLREHESPMQGDIILYWNRTTGGVDSWVHMGGGDGTSPGDHYPERQSRGEGGRHSLGSEQVERLPRGVASSLR